MTSVAVPDNDLAPNLPSREVTISATNVTEGGVSLRGQWVNFALSDSIDVTPGGDMIAKTSQTITLDSAGNGRIRLPVFDTSHGKGWESGKDWAIIVTTSWGSSKAIRVPAGSGSIPLSYLPAVRPLSRAEMRYAITGVGLTVSVGSTPGAAGGSASLDGGILRLGITVPPTGPHTHPTSDIAGLNALIDGKVEAAAFWRGSITSGSITGVTRPGGYYVWASVSDTPTDGGGVLWVSETRSTSGTVSQVQHDFYVAGSNPQRWARFRGSGGWSAWTWVGGYDAARMTQIFPADDLDDATTPGIHAFWGQAAHTPSGLSGTLIVAETRTTSGAVSSLSQTAIIPSTGAPELWSRFRGSSGFSGWKRIDVGVIDTSALTPSVPPPGGMTGWRTVPLALTVGGSGADGATSGSFRMPVRFGATINRWRIHFRNINPRFGTDGPTVSIPAVYFGTASTGGQFNVTPTQVGAALATGGGEAVTQWQSTPITKNTQYAIGYSLSGTQTNQVVGGGWSASSVNSTSATLTRVVSLPLDAWIEAEVSPDTQVLAAFGDSLSSGVGATLPVYDSWLSQWCRTNGVLPVHYTASGDTMQGWADSSAFKWQRWQGLSRPDAVVHAMGSNDVFGGVNLATMQSRRGVSIGQLSRMVSPVVYSATILPRSGVTGAQEDVRRSYNSWLMGRPDQAHAAFNVVPAVSSDDETLLPAYDSDSIHLTTDGYTQVAGVIPRSVLPPSLADLVAALP